MTKPAHTVRQNPEPIRRNRKRTLLHVCTLPGCSRATDRTGLCNLHYQRERVYGDPLHPGVKDRRPWGERLETRIQKRAEDESWPWIGKAKHSFGYGSFSHPLKPRHSIGSHRAAWIHFVGEIPDGMHVLHRCDNPSCCNPLHLFLGAASDNVEDMRAKGRNTKGARHPKAKLTEQQVRDIRSRYAPRGKGGPSVCKLSAEFGITVSTVQAILQRRIWKELA